MIVGQINHYTSLFIGVSGVTIVVLVCVGELIIREQRNVCKEILLGVAYGIIIDSLAEIVLGLYALEVIFVAGSKGNSLTYKLCNSVFFLSGKAFIAVSLNLSFALGVVVLAQNIIYNRARCKH